jgi:Zn finger protein HypA/HybF involved in hydrogenase expression
MAEIVQIIVDIKCDNCHRYFMVQALPGKKLNYVTCPHCETRDDTIRVSTDVLKGLVYNAVKK